MEAKEQRRQMSPEEGEEGENEASLSLPCGRQKWLKEIKKDCRTLCCSLKFWLKTE